MKQDKVLKRLGKDFINKTMRRINFIQSLVGVKPLVFTMTDRDIPSILLKIEEEDKLLIEDNESFSMSPKALTFDYRGVSCRVVRNNTTRTFCGYISGVDVNKVLGLDRDSKFYMYWGITYDNEEERIVGFDCCHCDDTMLIEYPDEIKDKMEEFRGKGGYSTYKTLEFVILELMKSVDLLKRYPHAF